MKICPFCAEEIKDAAVKCKHCGEFLDGRAASAPPPSRIKPPFYFGVSFIVFMICCVGPFALPLVWFRPRTRRSTKIITTVAVLVLSVVLFLVMRQSIGVIQEYYELMEGF